MPEVEVDVVLTVKFKTDIKEDDFKAIREAALKLINLPPELEVINKYATYVGLAGRNRCDEHDMFNRTKLQIVSEVVGN